MGERPPLAIETLPEPLKAVAETVGLDIAEALAALYPGQRLYVPHSWRPDSPLGALGEEKGLRLVKGFGGDEIIVPVRAVETQARWDEIRRLAAKGATVNEIASAVGLSYRRVQQVLAEQPVARPRRRVDPRQIDLFE